MSAQIEPGFLEMLLEGPQTLFHAIVRTAGSAESVAREIACDEGVSIHHIFRLIPGFSVTAPGEALLTLACEPGILAIEPDAEVRLFQPKRSRRVHESRQD